MILHTGGFACGAILTRSSPASCALNMASFADMIPSWAPSAPIRRTSLSLICSLILKLLIVLHLHTFLNLYRYLICIGIFSQAIAPSASRTKQASPLQLPHPLNLKGRTSTFRAAATPLCSEPPYCGVHILISAFL